MRTKNEKLLEIIILLTQIDLVEKLYVQPRINYRLENGDYLYFQESTDRQNSHEMKIITIFKWKNIAKNIN